MNSVRSLIPVSLIVAVAACSSPSRAPTVLAPHPKEAEYLAVLANSTELQARARACQELGVVGGVASVGPLAALLGTEHLGDYARSGLEGIRDPAAGEALRQALPRLEGRALAGAVASLGVRRERSAVGELRALAVDSRRGAAAEAVASLGMIGTPEAAKVLEQILAGDAAASKGTAAHAALVTAERLANEGHPAEARRLLEAIVRAVPGAPAGVAARHQLVALGKAR